MNDSSCSVYATVGGCKLCFNTAFLNIYSTSYETDPSNSIWSNNQWIINQPTNGSNQITISGDVPTSNSPITFDIINNSTESNVSNIGFYVGDGTSCSAGNGNGSITVPKATTDGVTITPAQKSVKIYWTGVWNLALN